MRNERLSLMLCSIELCTSAAIKTVTAQMMVNDILRMYYNILYNDYLKNVLMNSLKVYYIDLNVKYTATMMI